MRSGNPNKGKRNELISESVLPEFGLLQILELDFFKFRISCSGCLQRRYDRRVPPGSYGRIEMELRELCSGNGSVELENSFGFFSTREKFSLRFEGRFNLLNGADLKLNLFAWTSALSLVQNSAQLKPAFEAIQGKYLDR